MTLDRKKLSEYIVYAKKIARKNGLSVLDLVRVKVLSDKLLLTVTDLRVWFHAEIPFLDTDSMDFDRSEATGHEGLYLPSSFDAAIKLLRKKKSVSLVVIDGNMYLDDKMIIKGNRKIEDFPEEVAEQMAISGNIDNMETFRHAEKFTSDDETRYFMRGIHFILKEKEVHFESTDGRILCATEKPAGSFQGDDIDFILQDISTFDKLGLSKFIVCKKHVIFHDDCFYLTASMIDGQFPNVKRVIPDMRNQQILNIDYGKLKEFAKDAYVYFTANKVKKNHRKIILEENWAHAVAIREEVNELHCEIKTELTDFEFGLMFPYFKIMIERENVPTVSFAKTSPEKKAVVLQDENFNTIELYMPCTV